MKVVGTLRFRLTALYLAFFSLLFVLFSVFLYSLLGTSLRSRLDETLTSEVNTAAVMFQDELQEMKGNTELARSEERRVGKSVDLGGRRIIKKKKKRDEKEVK